MSPTYPTTSEQSPRKLQEAWEELRGSGEEITMAKIARLGDQFGFATGKWLLHAESSYKVDNLWAHVARAVIQGQCGISAKVSPVDDLDSNARLESYRHVICIYNNNFNNYDAVMDLEKQIRKAGIKCPLQYKPDVYTALGIYRKNPWKLRPTTYHSDYDVKTMRSRIMRVLDDESLQLVQDSSGEERIVRRISALSVMGK